MCDKKNHVRFSKFENGKPIVAEVRRVGSGTTYWLDAWRRLSATVIESVKSRGVTLYACNFPLDNYIFNHAWNYEHDISKNYHSNESYWCGLEYICQIGNFPYICNNHFLTVINFPHAWNNLKSKKLKKSLQLLYLFTKIIV